MFAKAVGASSRQTVVSAASSLAQAIPPYTDGMRIGLLGGSFNPPHAAHRAISLFALKRLKLDRVWWLVTPGQSAEGERALCTISASACKRRATSPTIRGSR